MSRLPTAEEIAGRRRQGLELTRVERPEATALHVLATFNLDLLPPFLTEAFDRVGRSVRPRAGAFGQLTQEILDPASRLYAEPPDEVLIVPAAEDLLEPLFSRPPSQLGPDEAEALVEERLAELRGLVETVLERLPAASCYVVALGATEGPHPHVLDPLAPERRQVELDRFMRGVRELRSLGPRTVVIDWDWHMRSFGWDAVRDERLWYLGRMRLNPTGCAALAELVARHAAAYRGQARKVLALDLDGTVWGGIVGEAGLGGIEVGEDGVGLAFQDFQRELVKLQETGVLLVVCSKNNPADALEVFERHAGMVLRREHLAAERINWQDKATNLRDLAVELNLGLDSFVFLDDNPIERTWISQACPEVLVPELPDDAAERPAFLRAASWFERIEATAADRGRSASYREQRERRQFERTSTSFEDFLSSLEQEAIIDPVHEGSLSRAAQLCQRTNQFNLTTRRHTVAELESMSSDPDHDLFTLTVRDRFGDNGITGIAILRYAGELAEIETLLMSCRILGRKLEDAFLAFLARRAADRGASVLEGTFVRTAKNAQVETFYPDHGFERAEDGVYRLTLTQGAVESPASIMVTVPANA
ncbi:MAG: HAD-IIIC family phosphatase [Gaiellaceae bacterium MAG52_C11]|nr:HAD-IIIC family phosphatase [Candidatus Gaiellasilicea maunaloa]